MSTRNRAINSATRFCFSTGVLAAAISGAAHALTIDLSGAGCTGSCSGTGSNGTIYQQTLTKPTGTGVFQPFLRLDHKDSEEGYNADYGNATQPNYDEKVGNWTHSIQFEDLTLVDIGGTNYYEFLLDLDEPNSGDKWGISLENVQIFNSGELSDPFPLLGAGALTAANRIYNMDSNENDAVWLNGALTSGNGQMDMSMFILASAFSGIEAKDYLTFYSKFGQSDWETEGSFEEWGVRSNPSEVPVPGTLGLLGMGVAALGMIRRKAKAPIQALA